MADVTPRFLWQNFAALSNSSLTVSSEDASFPRRWMLDPMKTMAWRSKIGWTVVSGFNDKLDFNLAGVKVATVTAGYYATGAALATAVQTALAAAYATGTWTVTYSANKFTITHSLTAHTLLNLTGANLATSILTDLGWNATADSSSATTHTGDNSVYQSRAYVKVDLAAATLVTAIAAAGLQSLTSTGKIKIQANATDAWTSPSYSTTILAANMYNDCLVVWTSQTYRYWRIVIDDPARSNGYQQIGVAYLGGYIQMSSPPVRGGVSDDLLHFSRSQVGDSGGIFVDVKTPAKLRTMDFNVVTDAEKVSLETMQATIDVRPQFYALDPGNSPATIEYGGVKLGPFRHFYGGGATSAVWQVQITAQQQLQ